MTDSTNHRDALITRMREFSTAMLVTHAGNGTVRSRPMAIAEINDDGTMHFATNDDSGKVDEIATNPQVNVAFQSGSLFASLTGTGSIVEDRTLIERLWKPDWKVWFPKGKSDPDLALFRVDPLRGEFWDITGANKLAFLWAAGKALVQGREMKSGGEHEKVELG